MKQQVNSTGHKNKLESYTLLFPTEVSQPDSLSASSHPSVQFFKADQPMNNLPYN